MSSLLQHDGETRGNRVVIKAYLTPYETTQAASDAGEPMRYHEAVEPIPCGQCGGEHPRLYRFARVPRGMFGCWVVFRFNGEDQVPDLSIPLALANLPRDAEPMTEAESIAFWHS